MTAAQKPLGRLARVLVNQRLAEEPDVDHWLREAARAVLSAWQGGYMSPEDGKAALAEVEDMSWRVWMKRNLD